MKKYFPWIQELILVFFFLGSFYHLIFQPAELTHLSFGVYLAICFLCASFSRYKFGVLTLGTSSFFVPCLYILYYERDVGISVYFVAPILFLLLHIFFLKLYNKKHIAQAYIESTIIFLLTFPLFVLFPSGKGRYLNYDGRLFIHENDFWSQYGLYILLIFLLLCYGVLLLHKTKLSRFRYLGSLFLLWLCIPTFPISSAVPAISYFYFNKKTIRILGILDRPYKNHYVWLTIFNYFLLAFELLISFGGCVKY